MNVKEPKMSKENKLMLNATNWSEPGVKILKVINELRKSRNKLNSKPKPKPFKTVKKI